MRRVVDQVVGKAHADPASPDAGDITAGPARKVVDVVVDDGMVAGSQTRTVAAVDADAAVAAAVDVASGHGVVGAALDPHGPGAAVANRAADDAQSLAAPALNAAAASRLHGQIAELHVADVLQRQQRLAHLRYHGLCLGQVARRPEVEDAVDAVNVVLAGLVKLLQDIEEIEPLPWGEVVVAVGRSGFH